MEIKKHAYHLWLMQIGRNWLSVLNFYRKSLQKVSLEPCFSVEDVLSKYATPWDRGLRTIKGVTAHLKLKGKVVPQFFKQRPGPFALKEKIADELRRLERIGIPY